MGGAENGCRNEREEGRNGWRNMMERGGIHGGGVDGHLGGRGLDWCGFLGQNVGTIDTSCRQEGSVKNKREHEKLKHVLGNVCLYLCFLKVI